jgi:hypothetical protein
MVHDIGAAHRHRAEWPRVAARVAADYEPGRHRVGVRYRHPVTGQSVDVDVVIVDGALLPRPGAALEVAVDPSNPDDVVVPGDGDPVRDVVLEAVFLLGVALVASLTRWWSMRRTERLVTSGQPAFAMLAVLHPGELNPRRVHCSLYPLDARAGSRPVCTFDALTTGGLPVGGPAFPVEVRGRPVPGGALVAHGAGRIIRPVRRPLTRGKLPFSGATTSAPDVLALAPPPLGGTRTVAPLSRCVGLFAPLCLAAAAIATAIVVPTVLVGQRRDHRLAAVGTSVIAQVVAKEDDRLTIRYRPPGAATDTEARVVGSPDRVIGRRYPAHADAAGRVHLDADPYDVVGPIGVLVAGWIAAVLLTWPRVRWWRDARRAARDGPWYQAVGHAFRGNLRVAVPGGASGAFAVTCQSAPAADGPPRPLLVAGSLEPHDAVALAGGYRGAGPASILDHARRRDEHLRLIPTVDIRGSGPEATR